MLPFCMLQKGNINKTIIQSGKSGCPILPFKKKLRFIENFFLFVANVCNAVFSH